MILIAVFIVALFYWVICLIMLVTELIDRYSTNDRSEDILDQIPNNVYKRNERVIPLELDSMFFVAEKREGPV